MILRARPVATLDAGDCAARARSMLAAVDDGAARIAGAVVRGPVAVLGARQREARVVRAGTTVVRRATTGTEAWVGGEGLWWSLALPAVNALVPDATPRTLLNRNVRGFLRGLTACGALAHYFGREVLAVKHRAAAVLGYDVGADGRVLVDVIAGWSEPVALPEAWRAARRAETPGPEAIALAGEVGGRPAEAVLARVIEAVAARAGARLDEETDGFGRETAPDPEVHWRAEARVPIGWLDLGTRAGRPWIGGDVLASTAWLTRAEDALARGEALPGDAVLEGALPDDIARAWPPG